MPAPVALTKSRRSGGVSVAVEVLIAARKRKAMSQLDLAVAIGVDKKQIGRIESTRRASTKSLEKIGKALGLTVEELIAADVPPTTNTTTANSEAPNPIGYSDPLSPNRPPADFTGYDAELQSVLAKLRGGESVHIAALRGQGGVGKTTLAEKAADELRDIFPTVVKLALNGLADEPKTPLAAMTEVVRRFRPDVGALDDAQVRPAYLTLLAEHKPLLILDNAKDAAQVAPLFECRPAGVGILITGRKLIDHPTVKTVRLGGLAPEKSLELLRGLVGPDRGTDAELAAVAALCGHLPLALRVAGSFLDSRTSWTVARYIEKLRGDAFPHLKLGTDDYDVEKVLAFSLTQLIHENAERAERYQMLGVFPADFDTAAAAAVWELDEDEAFEELEGLALASLIEDAVNGRWELHDLLRPLALRAFEFCEKENPLFGGGADRVAVAEKRFAFYYETILRRARELYIGGHDGILAGLALYDVERNNIHAGFCWAKKRLDEDAVAAQLCIVYPDAGAYILNLRINARERIDWLEVQLMACRQLKHREGEGAALGNLGTAWAVLGDARKAIGYYEQRLVIAREIGDRRGEGNALGNLGIAWADLGDARKAIGYYEQRLVIAREIGDRRGEGGAFGNLGNAWADLGDARKAIGYYGQSLDISRQIGDRRAEGQDLGNLGTAWADLGDARKAIGYYEQRLVIAREIGDRHGEGAAFCNLGIAWRNLRDARKAIEYYEEALVIAREIGDLRGEGSAFGNLGTAWADLGDARKAIGYYEQQLVIAREIGDRFGEANANFNSALRYHEMKEPSRAVPLAEAALAFYVEIGHAVNVEKISNTIEDMKRSL